MHLRTAILAFWLACVLSTQAHGQSVKWILQDFPPAQMPVNGQPGDGFQDAVVRVLVTNWPEASHSFVVANSARTWLMIADKEEVCYTGALQNPEREKIAFFSPFAVIPPLQLVVRKETFVQLPLNADAEVLLPELLASTTLKGMLVESRSYGKGLDDIIAQHQQKDAILPVQPGDMGKKLPFMLAAKRGDYIIEYDFILNFHKRQNQFELNGLISVPIAGYSKVFTTNVVCPRTPWGQKAIRRIDAILAKTVDSNDIRTSLESWLSPEVIKRYKADLDAFAQRRKKLTDPGQFEMLQGADDSKGKAH